MCVRTCELLPVFLSCSVLCCHLQCGLLSLPVLALEAEVLPAVAAGLHRAGAL